MKIKYLIIGAFLFSVGLGGCQKEVIDLLPPSSLTEADFYKTAKDMNGAVLGIYVRYQKRQPTDWALLELPSDNMYRTGYSTLGGTDQINNLAFTPDNPLFASFWQQSYNGIFRSNAVLANIENPIDYVAGQKEQLLGEAQFMRALFYFDLVRLFGGVPKVTSLLSIEESKSIPKAAEAEIYSLIVDDLKAAIENLPLKEDIATGRASKNAAVALLAKVYVYLKDWTNAKVYLDILETYNYQLLTDFASLWKIENEDNAEVILAIKYTAGTNGHSLSTYFLPYFGVSGISASGLEAAFPTWDIMRFFEDDDSRKNASVEEYWKSPGGPPDAPAVWYPYINKYAVPHSPNTSGLDIPVLRYADLVLLKAEVLYNLNQPALALVELNRIRTRAFMNANHNYSMSDVATPTAFLDKLLLERRLELAFENERWFDLVRTDRFMTELAQVQTSYNPTTGVAQTVTLNPKANYKYFPIPQTEIEKSNPGILVQNENY